MSFVVIDYETRSEEDLQAVGAHEYALHDSTDVICVAWRKQGDTAKSWCPLLDEPLPKDLTDIFNDKSLTLIAHNAFFEQVITEFVMKKYLAFESVEIERWLCTAARAAALALPRSLEQAAMAIRLPIEKDMEGRRLVLKYCKPRQASKKDAGKWHNDVVELSRLVEYCRTDVDVTYALYEKTFPLNETEKKVWILDQKINWRGFEIDRGLVDTCLNLIDGEERNLLGETEELTNGEVKTPKQVAKLRDYLDGEGVSLDNLQAKSVSDALDDLQMGEKARRLLEIRQDYSMSSTAKYKAFKLKSSYDGRVRDNLLYHGASTGRWSGRGVQPQNFPRGTIKEIETALELTKADDLEMIRLVFGSPMKVFSSLLRSVIVAPNGKSLYVGDYAAVEARVLFWVAKHERGLKAYRENRDLYKEMATRIFHVKLEDVTKDQRELAKRAVLGCGYGMGFKKFGETCAQYSSPITENLAKLAVNTYREVHFPVPLLWTNLENAAIAAVKNPGKSYSVNRTKWFVKYSYLWCELPSKRRLAFYRPSVKSELTPWKQPVDRLYHYSVDSFDKKWKDAPTYGGKITENVVQAIARDLMAEAMLALESQGYPVILTVHDEIVCEGDKGKLENFNGLMSMLPEWGNGLPVLVEAWEGDRYKK